MRRRILPRILALGVLVLALAGCVRFQADLELNADNTASGTIVIAVLLSDDSADSRSTAVETTQQISTTLLGDLGTAPGVAMSEYEQDGYLGQRLEFADVPFDAFSGTEADSLRIARDGEAYVFTGAIDFTGESVPSDGSETEDDGNLTVAVTFPGAVVSHNGELSGSTVSWSTAIDQRLEMEARGTAAPAGPPLVLIGVAIGAVLLVVVAVVVVVIVLRRRSPSAPATVAPAVAAPEAAPEAAPAPEVPPTA